MATKIVTYSPNTSQQTAPYDPNKLNVADMVEVVNAVNANADDLDAQTAQMNRKEDAGNKATDLLANDDTHYPTVKAVNTGIASKVSLNSQGLIDPVVLPVVAFSGLSGSGTLNDPYVVAGGSGGGLSASDLATYFQSLPGWAPDRFLAGTLQWVDPPTGEVLEKLETPVVTFGSPAGDAVQVNWNFVPSGLTYTLQRDTTNTFANAVSLFSAYGNGFFDVGLTPSTTYYYRVKVTASGFFGSNYGSGSVTTDVAGNVTPAAPTAPVTNDTANTFNWTNTIGYSAIGQYQYTLDGGENYATCTVKPLQIGDVTKPPGTVGVRVGPATGVNASKTLFNIIGFNKVVVVPAKPTNPITDDINDTFDWTNVVGWDLPQDYEYTTDSGGFYQTVSEKPLPVGDNSYAVGHLGVRVRAVADTNRESPTLFNTVAFYAIPVDITSPINTWSLSFGAIVDSSVPNTILFNTAYTAVGFGVAWPSLKIPVGAPNTILMCDARTGFAGTGIIGLDDADGSVSNPNQVLYNLVFQDDATYGRKIINAFSESVFISTSISLSSIKMRIRTDGTYLYYEYTLNSGGLWQQCGSRATLTGIPLYAKVIPQNALGYRNCFNIRQYGMIAS